VKAMNRSERSSRPDMHALELYFNSSGTMNRGQREHVVQFITEVCEDYGFAGQTAWTAVNYFDRYLAAATETPKRKVELISLSCLLVSSKFLECRSPSLEDLCTLSQNRLTKEDFMRSELMILTKVDWQLAVPSPHQYLLHIMHLLDSSGDCANKHHGPMLIQKHAEFFIDLSAFEYSMLSTPLGTIAGASFLCALRQLNFEADSPKEDFDVAALCDVLDVEQGILLNTAHHLMNCYYSCLCDEDPDNSMVFKPVVASRSESPDSIMAGPPALVPSGDDHSVSGESTRADSPDSIIPVPPCKSPGNMSVGALLRGRPSAKRSRATE